MLRLRALALCTILSLTVLAPAGRGQSPAAASSDDVSPGWHQWGGPSRNFHSASTGLAPSWPAGGPTKLWTRALGEGYSSVVADADSLYTMYREGDEEIVVALAATTGETRWEHRYQAPLYEDMDYGTWVSQGGPGPYSTPLLLGDVLYAVGSTGKFHALDRRTGEIAWFHDLDEEFEMSGYRGYAPSPIAYRDTIILPVGGAGQAVVAFDRHSGHVAWKNQDFLLAPASPVLIDVDGQDQLVVFAPSEIIGLDPTEGGLLWRHGHEADYGLNVSTPVWGDGNLLFVSSAYNGGTRVLHLSQASGATTVEELWFTNRLRLHFGNAIRLGDLMLASSGDFGPAFLTAVDVRTGEEAWRERTFARAQMVFADGRLIIVDEDGDLALVTATRDGLDVHARAELLTENAWTPPTLVGTTLYVRDRKSILAVDLSDS